MIPRTLRPKAQDQTAKIYRLGMWIVPLQFLASPWVYEREIPMRRASREVRMELDRVEEADVSTGDNVEKAPGAWAPDKRPTL